MALSSAHNRNPEGKNQYVPICESKFPITVIIMLNLFQNYIVTAESPLLQEALDKYHQGLITDNQRISELLLADHGIVMK